MWQSNTGSDFHFWRVTAAEPDSVLILSLQTVFPFIKLPDDTYPFVKHILVYHLVSGGISIFFLPYSSWRKKEKTQQTTKTRNTILMIIAAFQYVH